MTMMFVPSLHAPESSFTVKRGTPSGKRQLWSEEYQVWYEEYRTGNEREYPGTGKYAYVHGGGDTANYTNRPNPSRGNMYIPNDRHERVDGASTPRELEKQTPHTTMIRENVFKKDSIEIGGPSAWSRTLDVCYIDDALKEALRKGQEEYDRERISLGQSTSKALLPEDRYLMTGIQKEAAAWKKHYLTVKYDRMEGLLKLA